MQLHLEDVLAQTGMRLPKDSRVHQAKRAPTTAKTPYVQGLGCNGMRRQKNLRKPRLPNLISYVDPCLGAWLSKWGHIQVCHRCQ